MSPPKVLITRWGLTTPLGHGPGDNWQGILDRRSGIGHYPRQNCPAPFCFKGQTRPKTLPADLPGPLAHQVKFLNPGARLGLHAALQTMTPEDARQSQIPPNRRGLYIGSGDFTHYGYEFLAPALPPYRSPPADDLQQRQINRRSLETVNPFFLLESLHNNLFSLLSAALELKGPNATFANQSPSGLQALEAAFRAIRLGICDTALVVGYSSWLIDMVLYELDGLGLLSGCRQRQQSFRPFDRRRDGFIPGDGGAALLLQADGSAGLDLSGPPIGIKAMANCMEFDDGNALGVPRTVCRRSIQTALKDAGCRARELAFYNAHGSATPKGDGSEMRSVLSVFGRDHPDLPVCGLKPYTGHMGAASDIAEIILGIQAIDNQMAPATLHYECTEPEFSALNITDCHSPVCKNSFLSVSYGLGGQSVAAVIGRDRKKRQS